jgi:uncharacterized glyoxalase superfamily protein PhnB
MTGEPGLSAYPSYRDPLAAMDFLEIAFGFERHVVVLGPDDRLVHAEMRFGDSKLGVGSEWGDFNRSPLSVGGKNTQSVHVQLTSDIDAHYERAKAAGAMIVREIATQHYGDRTYIAADPEGHVWSFAQTVDAAERATWDQPGTTRTSA